MFYTGYYNFYRIGDEGTIRMLAVKRLTLGHQENKKGESSEEGEDVKSKVTNNLTVNYGVFVKGNATSDKDSNRLVFFT
jgi:hypothetical protein